MKKIYSLLLFGILTLNSFSQYTLPPDSAFYYNANGSKNWWYVQKDVFLYRMTSGTSHTVAPSSTIDYSDYLNATVRKQNRIKFKSTATPMQKAIVINSIGSASGFESASPAMSLTKNASYTANAFVETNDLILVRFAIPSEITSVSLANFMKRNNLSLYHQPYSNLTNPNSWTFIFRINNDLNATPNGDVFKVAQYVFTNEVGFVTNSEPDMKIYEPHTCETVTEFANNAAAGNPDGLWHIRNQGLAAYSGISGTSGSDAKICDCWGEGYHGENIKVAIVDFYGYDFSHPEMSGQFLNGWDCVNNVAITTTKYNLNQSHGMEVASVVAANANNGSTYNTVGVAYKSKILPYIIDGSSSAAIMAIQKAVSDGADIINMSWGSSTASTASQSVFYGDIQNAVTLGRGGLGCFVVASTGNNNANGKFFPAADFNVFGVGASDASDNRGVVPTWGWTGGSNYLTPVTGEAARYNVTAPGTRIFTAFTQTPLSSPTYMQSQQNGTSFAAPIVSGIGAILLSKNPSLTEAQVRAAIQGNTDLVKPFNNGNYALYSFLPGYADEMFYGRVNCYKAIQSVAVGIHEYSKENIGIQFTYLNQNEMGIFFTKGFNDNGSFLTVYDVTGKIVTNTEIEKNVNGHILNTNNYVQGMYIIKVLNKSKQNGQTFKFIK